MEDDHMYDWLPESFYKVWSLREMEEMGFHNEPMDVIIPEKHLEKGWFKASFDVEDIIYIATHDYPDAADDTFCLFEYSTDFLKEKGVDACSGDDFGRKNLQMRIQCLPAKHYITCLMFTIKKGIKWVEK
jgi:hypothetical protein